MQWADGQIYCGAWMKNMRHGRGIQTTPDGAIIYCGQWNSDLPLDDGGKHVPSEQELKLIAEIRNGIPSHVEMHLPVSAQTIIANRPNGASNVSSDHPQQFNADNGVSPRKHDATDEEIRQRNAHIAAVNSSCSDQLGIALADIHIADAPPAARLVV
uniref:Uncharacterized protein n=1 Tax=Craspedostauros australis TaxID=1486917 RepID=A0A7R9WN27_9STRA|mmetsp:Transcript_1260/g.3640  ORF Transcript_1260/g.3640 Transcript_1260/m.3640 type:complete len:157 (+) Transcript_1260:771-1241(+)